MSQDQMIDPSSIEGVKDSKNSWFSVLMEKPFQRRIVSYGLTSLCACLLGGAIWIAVDLTVRLAHVLMPLWASVIIGLFLSYILRPLYDLIRGRRKRVPHLLAFGVTIALLLVLLGFMVVLLYSDLCPQIPKIVKGLPDLFDKIVHNMPKGVQEWIAAFNLYSSVQVV